MTLLQYSIARRYAQLLEDAEHRMLTRPESAELLVLECEVRDYRAADASLQSPAIPSGNTSGTQGGQS